MADAIYVKPTGETEQCEHCGGVVNPEWVVLDSDGETEIAGPFQQRADAKGAAIEQSDGLAVVLLRADGSVHSEMRAAGEGKNRRYANLSREKRREKRLGGAAGEGQVVEGGTAADGSE